MSWERIQLFVHLAVPSDLTLPPPGVLYLEARDTSASPLRERPLAPDAAPDRRAARFNVFVDDDQMPLPPGRWELVVRGGGDASEPIAVWSNATFHADPVIRDFPTGDRTYRVSASSEPGAPFSIEIAILTLGGQRQRRPLLRRLIGRTRQIRRRSWTRLFILLVRLLGRLPRRTRTVVFTSDSRVGFGGNLKLVHDRMIARGLDRDVRIRSIFKPSIRMRRSLVDRARLVWLLARAEAIVMDDYQPAIYRLPQRSNQRIIQLWHAWGAFKTVGYSRIGKPGGPSPWSVVHKNYTWATASSSHEVPFYAEAFGLPDERVVATGTPRMDEFLDPEHQATRREAARELLPGTQGREVMMFAPTFRGRSARDADYPVELIDVAALHDICSEREAVCLIRLHPFVRSRVAIAEPFRDRILDVSELPIDTNDLLLISDRLITDYSSLIFEFAALDRPMLFFAFDQDEYIASHDFYEPYESFVPGRICRSFEELLEAIRDGDDQREKVAPFARRHLPAQPASATDRIIDQLILER